MTTMGLTDTLDTNAIEKKIKQFPARHWKKLYGALSQCVLRNMNHNEAEQFMSMFEPLPPKAHQERAESFMWLMKLYRFPKR